MATKLLKILDASCIINAFSRDRMTGTEAYIIESNIEMIGSGANWSKSELKVVNFIATNVSINKL